MKNVTKILSGTALGAIVTLSSLTSAHAAELPKNHQNHSIARIEVQKEHATFISKDRAQRIVLNKCRGSIQSCELKNENGVNFYYFYILGQDGNQHCYKVNCENGYANEYNVYQHQFAYKKERTQEFDHHQSNRIIQSFERKNDDRTNAYRINGQGERDHQYHSQMDNHLEQQGKQNIERR